MRDLLSNPALRRGLAVCMLLLAATAAKAAPLQISEFLAGPARDWDGSGAFSSRDDEWVEVRNASAQPLELTGYFLTDGDSIPRFAFAGSLGPGERQLVFGRTSYDWEHAHGLPAFGLSLGNSGDAVMLWQVVGPDTTLVDSYTYHSHEAAADRSVGRWNDDGAWSLYDGLNPYTGSTLPAGTGCNPSPGLTNACTGTANHALSWGRLKRRYRDP